MRTFLSIICILLIDNSYGSQKKETFFVVEYDGEVHITTENQKIYVAKCDYIDNTNVTGWAYLTVKTSRNYPDDLQSYSAGFCEGYASYKIIYDSWRNTLNGFCSTYGQKFCDDIVMYLNDNFNWMKEQITASGASSAYWYQVDLILGQLVGLHDGYNKVSKNYISQLDFLLMNLFGDMQDLPLALDPKHIDPMSKSGHCSVLIKVLEKNADLFISHVSWNSYQNMLRVLKKYEFNFRNILSSNDIIPGHTAVFSSYPAYLTSEDDFTVLSSSLVSVETTIDNHNEDLWKHVQPDGQVHTWIRSIVANRLATSGKGWTDIFKKYNSGTYNNQWMIIDYNKFKAGKPIQNDTLWILEQMPSLIVAEDKSDVLRQRTYWPSYNIPFYTKIFNMSDLPAIVKKYGDFFTYDKTPRALMFDRDHHKVKDMDSLIKLMRYNDYKNDPLSKCECKPPYSAENAISARGDLNPKDGTYPFAKLGHRLYGGIDLKATSYKYAKKLSLLAIAGPTYDQQPVFKWSEQKLDKDVPHFGHPDAFKFPSVNFNGVFR